MKYLPERCGRVGWLGGIAVCGCLLVLAVSCSKQPAEQPPATRGAKPDSPVLHGDQGHTQSQVSVQASTGTVDAVVSVTNQIASMRTQIVDVAARRGSISGRLGELRLNALSGGDAVISEINAEIGTMREAMVKRLGELPEIAGARKRTEEIEGKRKDLLAQRTAIAERKRKGGGTAEGAQVDQAEQLRNIDISLAEVQKEFQRALTEQRRLVQRARETSPEIGAIAAGIAAKDAALAEHINSLPGIKELLVEQAKVDAELRDMRTRLRLLENPQPQATPAP
ncbi:MAG: hypothetical protein WCL44_05615 [bacterium]